MICQKAGLWTGIFLLYGMGTGAAFHPDRGGEDRVPLTRYLNASAWNKLFPHRYNLGSGGTDFYSFQALVAACRKFPEFLAEADTNIQKRELAAFLANVAQETSGGWAQAPGGYFTWGLYFVRERTEGASSLYGDTSKHAFPPMPGRSYAGRGPAQLSWNYNYGQFSQAWFGDKAILLKDPDRLATDPRLSFGSALWFWMTAQFPKPSCHAIMSGQWVPSVADREKGRLPGFGSTVNVINGGMECGRGKDLEKTANRYAYYRLFCGFLDVTPGENIQCSAAQPFGQ